MSCWLCGITEEVASLNNILNKNFVTEFIENIKGKFKCLLGNIATNSNNYYRPQHSCGKVMISQASVSDTPREDTPLGRHPLADTSLLGRHTPSWVDTHPPGQTPLGRSNWADPPGQTPSLDRHPRADSYCSGLCASYWNAFLF